MNPKQGYWFGLCMSIAGTEYNTTYAVSHYAMQAVPHDYGSTGENTYIINEEGTVYSLDRGVGTYLVDYPSTTPVDDGWVMAE